MAFEFLWLKNTAKVKHKTPANQEIYVNEVITCNRRDNDVQN